MNKCMNVNEKWINVAHLHRGRHQSIVDRGDINGSKEVAVHVIDSSDVVNVSSILEKGVRLTREKFTIDYGGQIQFVHNWIWKISHIESYLIFWLCANLHDFYTLTCSLGFPVKESSPLYLYSAFYNSDCDNMKIIQHRSIILLNI